MGIAVMEDIVKTVGAILKTLECPICLELLKTPVSAGCGHFFCRECISEILHSSYRAPCPLCKRSFTRRSIQEAEQRQTVILAAEALAKTCSNLTGVDFILPENVAKQSKKSLDGPTPSAKKLKVTPKEKQDGVSKKRKSCEYEDSSPQVDVKDSNSEMKKSTEGKENSDVTSDECFSAKKRVCFETDGEDDSGDFPSLEEIFSQRDPSPKATKASVFDKLLPEKPLSITPTDKFSNLKTYSHFHKKHESKLKASEELNSNTTEKVSHTEKELDGSSLLSDKNENEVRGYISVEKGEQIKRKNKVNALKNKTNEGESDKYILQEDCFLSKVKDSKNARNCKIVQAEREAESKENELFSNSTVLSNQSPSKNSNSRKAKRKLNKKSQESSIHTVSSVLHDKDKNLQSSNSVKCKFASEKNSIVKEKDESNSKSYTLNETTISPHSLRTENIGRKSVDDPLGLTDTAVCVDAVKSPLTGRALSFKSPGWSRVKKVKKDFKVKKFSALQVEKNSPFLSHKHGRPGLDTVGSEQDVTSPSIDRSNQSVEVRNKISDLDPQSNFEDNVRDIYDENPAQQGIGNQKNPVELDSLNANKDKATSDDKEVGVNKQSSESLGRTGVGLENCELEMQNQIEEMDCSNTSVNGSHGFSVSNIVENAIGQLDVDMQEVSVKKCHSNTEANVLIDSVSSNTANITNKKLSSKSVVLARVNNEKFCQNLRNAGQEFGDLQIANELNENSGLNTSLSEGKEMISKKEKLISKHAYVVYDDCTELNKDELCSSDITPKRKKNTLTVKTQIAEYQRFQTQSLLNEDEDLQYVEHSQQTSQMAFNFDHHQNPVYNNFALIPQQQTPYLLQQHLPLPSGNSSTGKTKVVKRTCLTLEEIQDYFYKSNVTNSSEKVCSVPFLSGQFMLDICVSEETLNVSVLKVIDQISESSSNILCPLPVVSDKGIQSSNSLFNVPSPVLPSSNSTDPNSVVEPFPYLNKLPHDLKESKPSSGFAEETVTNAVESSMKENDLKISEVQDDPNENYASENFNRSEIIHFPNEHIQKDDHPLEKDKNFGEIEHCKNSHIDCPSPQENAEAATEPFFQEENEIGIELGSSAQKGDSKEICEDNSKLNDLLPHKKDKSPEFQPVASDDFSDSEKEASLKKLQQCASKELVVKCKKLSRLSLKKKSKFRRTQILDSSDDSDVEQDSIKKISEENENIAPAVSGKPSEITLTGRNSPAFKEPGNTTGLENAVNSLVAPELEMPCTLNSVLSEDVPETNASEIILEIEDLSDKIKFLEEKLKQCGHVDEEKSESDKQSKTSPTSTSLVHGSDSEDSNDLFPQSVPPTPPEVCGPEANSNYKSSFYKTS